MTSPRPAPRPRELGRGHQPLPQRQPLRGSGCGPAAALVGGERDADGADGALHAIDSGRRGRRLLGK
jgi:hypothetical protein